MNRRSALLAVLAAPLATAQTPPRGTSGKSAIKPQNIIEGVTLRYDLGGAAKDDTIVLEVVHGERIVRITAKQLMDALEKDA